MRDAPSVKYSRRPTRPVRRVGDPQSADEPFDTPTALLRLLVGGLLFGADEMRARLRTWEDLSRSELYAARLHETPQVPGLHHMFLGVAFDGERRLRRGASRALRQLARAADDADFLFNRLSRATRGTPLDLLRAPVDEAFWRVRSVMDSLATRGAAEEQLGRRMAERATGSVIDELLDYMARDPELRNLIEQQGMGIASAAVDDVREHVAATDIWLERLARQLLHRRMGNTGAGPARTDAATPQGVVRSTEPSG